MNKTTLPSPESLDRQWYLVDAENQTLGRLASEVAQVLRGTARRGGDLVARIGGEEFLIALPGVNLEQAITVIDRIRSDFAALPHAHPGGALHATFSAGVASFPMFDAAADLTEAADRALLHAKRLGRNRVEAAVMAREFFGE